MPTTNIQNDENNLNTTSSSAPEFSDSVREDLSKKLTENYELVQEKIKKTFDSVRLSLDNRQAYLLNELKKIYDEKSSLLDFHLNELSARIDYESNETLNLSYSFDFTEENTQTNGTEFSSLSKPHKTDLEDCINSYGRIITKPIDPISPNLNNLECSISGRGLKQCYANEESLFALTFKNRDGSYSSKSNVSFLDIFIVTSEIDTNLTKNIKQISNNTFRARQITKKNSLPKTNRCNCECKLECLADGVYEVKYKLDKRGTYSLNILVNKIHIGNSPYRLECLEKVNKKPILTKAPIKSHSSFSVHNLKNSQNKENKSIPIKPTPKTSSASINTKSSSSNSLTLPNNHSRLSNSSTYSNISKSKQFSSTNFTRKNDSKTNLISQDDSLMSSVPSMLSDSLNSSISPAISKNNISNTTEFINTAEDDFLFQIGRRGRNGSEFMNPQAVCASNELIYITDSNNQKIDVFSHSGEFKFTLGSTSLFNSKIIRRPCGVDASLDGRIFVVDYEYKCVNVFEESGKFTAKICQNKLLGPKGICLNKANQNQIVIADAKANAVCLFDIDGKFVKRFGNLGSKNENFAGPQYVSCMSNADIVVTDFYNHCIKVFDFNGIFRFSFGSNGSNQGQFNGPTGVAVDQRDNIIVVDWGNSRVQVNQLLSCINLTLNQDKLRNIETKKVFDKHGVFIRYINTEVNQLYGPQDVAVINNTVAVADSGNHCVKIYEYS